ncbi:MAG: hypothetical protein ACF8SC_08385 [Phycisphaerales bacterium JB037]
MNGRVKLAGMIAGAAGLVLAAAASAQPERDPLRGPRVQQREADRLTGQFGDQIDGRRRAAVGGELEAGAYMRAVMGLARADADLRLNDEQGPQIRAIFQDYRNAQREHMEQSRGEVEELMKQAGLDRDEMRRERQGPGAGADRVEEFQRRFADATPEQREAMARLREMRAEGPGFGPFKERLGQVLSAEQMKWVEVEVAQMREQAEARRAGAMDEMGAADARRPAAGEASQDIVKSRRLAQVLRRLTPEQQDALAEMLERRLEAGGAEGGRGQLRGEPGQGRGGEGAPPRRRPRDL